MNTPTEERFRSRVYKTAECWFWLGCKGIDGYGKFSHKPGISLAHRYSYELYKGPIPAGLHIDHLCRVRHCVNPDHLEAVTQQENMRRGNVGLFQKSKTHCRKGHPYSGDNLLVYRGGRHCRACKRVSGGGLPSGIPRPKITQINAAKTHCKHGHELSGANLYIWPGDGKRKCRQCQKRHQLNRKSALSFLPDIGHKTAPKD